MCDLVSRFPSQEHVGNDAKIPTIMYYDQAGNVRAVGAEALKENIIEQAEEDGWVKYSECVYLPLSLPSLIRIC